MSAIQQAALTVHNESNRTDRCHELPLFEAIDLVLHSYTIAAEFHSRAVPSNVRIVFSGILLASARAALENKSV